jgi:hypothetical protein
MLVTLYRRKDFFAGLLFIAVGVLTSLLARHYPLGTAMRMGPGYFPFILGLALAALGLLILLGACKFEGDHVEPLTLKPILFVGGSLLLFALAIRPLGFLLAASGLVVISGLAHWETRWRELGALSLALTAFSAAVFHYGLGLPFDLLPV